MKRLMQSVDVCGQQQQILNTIYNDFSDLFTESLGVVPNFQVSFKMKANIQPIFVRPRTIPYALKERVEHEIDRLESQGTIEKVEYSPWGTPIVPVVRSDGSIRLCADYKITIKDSWIKHYKA
jgi:hypothetical protein